MPAKSEAFTMQSARVSRRIAKLLAHEPMVSFSQDADSSTTAPLNLNIQMTGSVNSSQPVPVIIAAVFRRGTF